MHQNNQDATHHESLTASAIEIWLREHLAAQLDLVAAELDIHERFSRYGLNSLRATSLIAGLSQLLKRPLSPTLVWDYPTIDALVRFLTEGDQTQAAVTLPSATHEAEPIAIVGLACRFPGAKNAAAYWQLLMSGVDAISEIPPERWDIERFYSSSPSTPGKMSTRWGGFLDQVDQFDAEFFGIAPREAIQIDPQQRLVLELAWEALEDAGIAPKALKGSATGVFCGAMWHDYARLFNHSPEVISQYTATSQDLSIISARVSYLLGLQGPSMVVNTACSSSLVAIHLACQSLRTGEATLALAGGVNLIIAPESTVAMSKFGAMAPDGRSKAFDARANGYVRGEGAGIVVLKPLSRALADGDPIHCVIRGSAVNNDGFSNGLTAPNPQAQVAMLQAAYRRAGVQPERVHYVETHGTGTILGDPIEANAIGSVLGAHRAAERPLLIGSVKTNIGHLEAAAGIAGLIKTVLAIRNQTIPPNLHFDQPNPHVPFETLRLRVPQTPEPWPFPNELPLAGVSAFGFGGTNCHIVLEGASAQPTYLLPVSAPDPDTLREVAGIIKELAGQQIALPNLCYTAAQRLSQHPRRLALAARTQSELVVQLERWLEAEPTEAEAQVHPSAPKVVFVFPGQGGQWLGMGRQLLRQEPAFRAALYACDAAFRPFVPWSLLDVLQADAVPDAIDVVQPVLFAVEVALAALWRSWGVEPAAVIGHSMGEVAAAYVAGGLSLVDAARVICVRSRLLRQISGQGTMAVVELAAAEAETVLAAYDGAVVVAALNGPTTTVIAGTVEAVEAVVTLLTAQGVFARRVQVDVASHSPQVDRLGAALLEELAAVEPQATTLPLYSTVRGRVLAGTELDAGYWVDNLRQPVQFAPMVARLLDDGLFCFLEISPHPVLGAAIERNLERHDRPGAALASTRRDEDERTTMLDTIAKLYLLGQPIRWQSLYPQDVEPVDLPPHFGAFNWANQAVENEPDEAALLPLSAHTPQALTALAQQTVDLLKQQPNVSLQDLCYTAGARRTHHSHRLAIAAASRADLIEQIESYLTGEHTPSQTPTGAVRKVVFVFPGQGGQWLGMGRQLLRQEPAFRAALYACDAAFRPFVPWSLLDVLQADAVPDAIDVVQPVLFAVEVALAALWRSWGVEPAAVIGHSMGEVAAAYVAGGLSLVDAARVICVRSRLLRQISGQGTMAVVELAAAEAETVLAAYDGAVVVAALNGPTTTVIAGTAEAVEAVVTLLTAQGVFARRVQVDVASHSPQVEGLRSALLEELAAVEPQATTLPLYSTVRGRVLAGTELDAAYWVDNLRQPVQFAPMVARLLDDGLTCFLEISPHPTLTPAIEQSVRRQEHDGMVFASLRRNIDERLTLLESVGMFYCLGLPLVWSRLYPASGKVLRLPDYPWQRERFWLGDQTKPGSSAPRRTAGHPLLGEHVESSLNWGTHFWATELGVDLLPYLNDHRVRGQCILPATAYVEMALSAASEVLGTQARTLEQLDFKQALTLSGENPQMIQVTLTAQTPGTLAFQCASRQPKEHGQSAEWLTHASGTIKVGVDHSLEQALGRSYAELRQRLAVQTGEEHYAAMQARGLEYGPSFQGVSRVWRQAGEALGQIRLTDEASGPYRIHPVLLDSCFQIAIAALPSPLADAQSADTYVPVGIERLQVNRLPGSALWCYAQIRPQIHGHHQRYAADLVVLDEDDQVVIAVSGLLLQRIEQTQPALNELFYEIRWQQADSFTALAERADWRGKWLVFANSGSTLTAALEASGGTGVVVHPGRSYDRLGPNEYQIDPTQPEHFRLLLADAFSAAQPCRGVIHLWALQTATAHIDAAALEQGVQLGLDSVLHLIQALNNAAWTTPPRLWLVTRGSQAVVPSDSALSIIQAPIWGLGRTIQHEHPDLNCTRIDLGPELADQDQALLTALLAPDNEPELALRADGMYVSRLVQRAAEDSAASLEPAGDRPFRLEISRPGTLDHLQLRAFELREPGPDEVLIAVRASGLNFRDVLKTLGMYPGLDGKQITLGDECAGTIVAIGSNVTGLQIGDAVVAVAMHSFGTHVIANAQLVAPKPAQISFEEAATIPIAFVTAAYALEYLGRIDRGERVLIHAAAGGVGLAAVQLAQAAGAEIFATAGNDEKRSFLRSLGVPHVLDSRSLAFADQVLTETNGKGVDLVLNSLSGDFIPNSIATLAPYGRFLEIGKRDIYQNRQIGLEPFRRNLAFFAIDLERMFVERPKLIGSLLRQIVGRVAAGELQPLPMQIFTIADVDDAFHMMEQARHIGKIVVSVAEREIVPIDPTAYRPAPIRADATYLITGGFGGLGLSVAQWLADQGARQVVLVGRSGAPASAQPAIDALSQAGVHVVALAADVTRADDVAQVLSHIRQHLPPLRGIIHAVGILDDGILLQQSAERFRAVVQPKVDGAWNLHAQTLGSTDTAPLDFFVLFSSVTSVLGSPGQSNYAAANAFLDALAHARRAAGLPALSINWCPWSAVGMAARLEQRGQQALRGLRAITPQQGVMALGALLQEDTAQVSVMSFNAAEWIAAYPASARSNQLALLATETAEQPATLGVRDSLLAVEPGRRRRIALETYVREQVSHVLRLAPSRIGITTPLRSLGLDSLMSLELRNRLEAGLQLSLSASLTWNYPTIEVLVPYLAERMQIPLDVTDREPSPILPESLPGNATNLNDELSGLSAEDLETLLLQELEDLDL